jgi:hypothetical protein
MWRCLLTTFKAYEASITRAPVDSAGFRVDFCSRESYADCFPSGCLWEILQLFEEASTRCCLLIILGKLRYMQVRGAALQ